MKEKTQAEQLVQGAFVDVLYMERPLYLPKNGAAMISRAMVGFLIGGENEEGLAFHISDSLSIFSPEDFE